MRRARRVAGSFRTLGVDAFREWLDANVYSRVGREKFPRRGREEFTQRTQRRNTEGTEEAKDKRAA